MQLFDFGYRPTGIMVSWASMVEMKWERAWKKKNDRETIVENSVKSVKETKIVVLVYESICLNAFISMQNSKKWWGYLKKDA